VAERIRQLRKARGLTQAEVAHRLGQLGVVIDQAAVARFEQGKRRTTIDDLFALAVSLGVSPLAFLTSDDNETLIELTPESAWRADVVRSWLMFEAPIAVAADERFLGDVPDAYQAGRPATMKWFDAEYPELASLLRLLTVARNTLGKEPRDTVGLGLYLQQLRQRIDQAALALALEMDEDARDFVGWDRSGRARNRPTYADDDRTS
jgi:transcriptional regulator with XRE-family HTH domain